MEVSRDAMVKTPRRARRRAAPVEVERVAVEALKLARQLARERGYRVRVVSATEIRLE